MTIKLRSKFIVTKSFKSSNFTTESIKTESSQSGISRNDDSKGNTENANVELNRIANILNSNNNYRTPARRTAGFIDKISKITYARQKQEQQQQIKHPSYVNNGDNNICDDKHNKYEDINNHKTNYYPKFDNSLNQFAETDDKSYEFQRKLDDVGILSERSNNANVDNKYYSDTFDDSNISDDSDDSDYSDIFDDSNNSDGSYDPDDSDDFDDDDYDSSHNDDNYNTSYKDSRNYHLLSSKSSAKETKVKYMKNQGKKNYDSAAETGTESSAENTDSDDLKTGASYYDTALSLSSPGSCTQSPSTYSEQTPILWSQQVSPIKRDLNRNWKNRKNSLETPFAADRNGAAVSANSKSRRSPAEILEKQKDSEEQESKPTNQRKNYYYELIRRRSFRVKPENNIFSSLFQKEKKKNLREISSLSGVNNKNKNKRI